MNADEQKLRVEIADKWRVQVIASLRNYGLQPDLKKDTEDLYLQLLHFQRRCVEARKRTIYEAKELTCPTDLKEGYSAFKQKVEDGADLVPHLSTRIEKLKTRDHLLNDWGVHHFHLGLAPKPDQPSFMERTGNLLFALVRREAFYAIGFWHHQFEDAEVLKVIQKNWPQLLESDRCKGIVGMENPNITADEIRQLRQAGIMTLHQVGNQVFFPPGGGFTSTGDNAQDVLLLDKTLHVLNLLPGPTEERS